MSALKALQDQFQAYLIHGSEQNMLPEVAPDKRFSADRRLKVYYDAYRIRLCEILKLDFTKTHTLMGDEHFDDAFALYLAKFPSQHFSVRYFGQHFSDFLAQTNPFSDYPMVAEMAQFEWLVNFTIDAADGPIISTDTLAKLAPDSWPDLKFTFHPSLASCYFNYDTPQLWQHIENEEPPRQSVQQEQPVRWLFWRKGLRSYFQSCTPAEDRMFQALQAGLDFTEACEAMMEFLPEEEVALKAAQTLYKWANEEMIGGVG